MECDPVVFMQVGAYLFGTEFAADKGVDVLNELRIEFIGLSLTLFDSPALPLGFFGAVLLPLGTVPFDFAADGAFVAIKLFGDFGDGAVAGQVLEHLLKRRFKAQKPNEKWLTDVTELKGSDGKLYLSPILDLFNREIVAYAMRRNANSEMVKEMLEKAAPRLTDKGTMLHSDQGVLYRTAGYRELLAEHSMVQSMSRKANCWDNAPMESFFAVLKTECFYNAGELTVDELMKQIDDYMDYYNRERCSLKLKKLSPVAYRTQLTQSA
ncbi:MAG: IS3 family transposase [Neisseria lactamica]|nr:IS3 family transposase [Neisseria lactamica]